MEIVWLGHSSFKLKGKDAVVVTDPYEDGIGIRLPKVEAQIVTVSHQHTDHNFSQGVSGDPFVIQNPGEYEIKGISVFGIPTFHDETGGKERGGNTVYVIDIDGVKVCHMGDIGHKPSEGEIEEINSVDVLLVPVGGFYTVSPAVAVEVVKSIDPSIVIPMHYKTPELSEEIFGKLSGVEEFVTLMGVEAIRLPKLQVSRDKLGEQLQLVVLERRGA